MAELEANLLTYTTHQPYVWWQFIDDIFAIWKHGRETLKQFLQEINLFHQTIKFTAEYSEDRVNFLDTTAILDGTTIHTRLYGLVHQTNRHTSVLIPRKLPSETLHNFYPI